MVLLMKKIIIIISLTLLFIGKSYSKDTSPLLRKNVEDISIAFLCVDPFDDNNKRLYGFSKVDRYWFIHNIERGSDAKIFANASFFLFGVDDKTLNFTFPLPTGFFVDIFFTFNSDDLFSDLNQNIKIRYMFFKPNNEADMDYVKQLNSLYVKNLLLKDSDKLHSEILSLFGQTSKLSKDIKLEGAKDTYCVKK
tara:strand:+ start:145 stop:726 length:582 start_codon:yes stop_codon:yes gene_type:complete